MITAVRASERAMQPLAIQVRRPCSSQSPYCSAEFCLITVLSVLSDIYYDFLSMRSDSTN